MNILKFSSIYMIAALAATVFMNNRLYAGEKYILNVQGAAVFTSYNDVALPGDTGTKFSFNEDIDSEVAFSPRIEAGYEFPFHLYAGIMASTLRIDAEGRLGEDVVFNGKTFAEGTDVDVRYRFDSYRATVRYYFVDNESFKAGAGFTGKIRDAEITMEGGGEKGGLTNTGFVPIINFYFEWLATPELSVLVYGDAAWSPYGRAEDYFAGMKYNINSTFQLYAGYRMLEGGADNDEVYTFSMFHYAVIGAGLSF